MLSSINQDNSQRTIQTQQTTALVHYDKLNQLTPPTQAYLARSNTSTSGTALCFPNTKIDLEKNLNTAEVCALRSRLEDYYVTLNSGKKCHDDGTTLNEIQKDVELLSGRSLITVTNAYGLADPSQLTPNNQEYSHGSTPLGATTSDSTPLDGGWGAGNHKKTIKIISNIKTSLNEKFQGSASEHKASREMLKLIQVAEDIGLMQAVAYSKAIDRIHTLAPQNISACVGFIEDTQNRFVTTGLEVNEQINANNHHISISLHLPKNKQPLHFFGQSSRTFNATLFRFNDGSVDLVVDTGKTTYSPSGDLKSGVEQVWELSNQPLDWGQGFTEQSNGMIVRSGN